MTPSFEDYRRGMALSASMEEERKKQLHPPGIEKTGGPVFKYWQAASFQTCEGPVLLIHKRTSYGITVSVEVVWGNNTKQLFPNEKEARAYISNRWQIDTYTGKNIHQTATEPPPPVPYYDPFLDDPPTTPYKPKQKENNHA